MCVGCVCVCLCVCERDGVLVCVWGGVRACMRAFARAHMCVCVCVSQGPLWRM